MCSRGSSVQAHAKSSICNIFAQQECESGNRAKVDRFHDLRERKQPERSASVSRMV